MKRTLRLVLASAVVALLRIAHATHATHTEPDVLASRNETVVLLHGLARTKNSMNKMASELEADGYRVINHGYPSTKATIDELAANVFKALGPQIQQAEAVHFVTHSLGGIILRQHLEDHTIPNLGRVVMLGPPSRGSEVPDRLGGIFLFKWLNGPAGNQLGTDTNSVPLQLGAPAFDLGVIAGDRSVNPILSMMIPGPDDGKVALARVKPSVLTDYAQIHATHTFIARNPTAIAQTKHFLKHGEFKKQEVSHD